MALDNSTQLMQELASSRIVMSRVIVTIPIVFIIFLLISFVFQGKSLDVTNNDVLNRVIVVIGVVLIIAISYLMTGLIFPKPVVTQTTTH